MCSFYSYDSLVGPYLNRVDWGFFVFGWMRVHPQVKSQTHTHTRNMRVRVHQQVEYRIRTRPV